MEIVLLATRPRVEERQLIAAFAKRGREATLVDPATLRVSLAGHASLSSSLAIDRGVSTSKRAALATLLAVGGTTVVNRAATARLLANRLAFFRHLTVGGVPMPDTIACFGERATLDALETIGYPAFIVAGETHSAMPDAIVEDADAGEAIVEHRTTLGGTWMTLVQPYIEGETIRLAIVGDEIVGIERVVYGPGGAVSHEPWTSQSERTREIGAAVVARLGSGVYEVKIVESEAGPVVVGAGNLIDFRSIAGAGVDIAGRIADFALEQIPARETVAIHD